MEWISASINLLALAGILVYSIKYLIQAKINSYFNMQLKTYEQKLAIITKNAEYDISKKLYDFEAYASKKHTVYPELYGQAFEIWTELKVSISKFNKEEKTHLDKDTLERRFYEGLTPIAAKFNTAFDYFYRNELYLSKNTAIAYEDTMRTQFSFLEKIGANFQENLNDDDWQDPDFLLIKTDQEHYHSIKEKMSALKEIMYKELSYTHFEEIEKKEEALS